MAYKVLIPTAGTGSRLGTMTKYLNKSLVNISGKPAISRIIEMFPKETQFVIATGYKGELVREYLSLAYPDRVFQYAEVPLYEGEGSGLGLTILQCQDLLQEPFIFCSCDTIVGGEIPEPEFNWMGCAYREELTRYRTVVSDENGWVAAIHEKGEALSSRSRAYIGLAGIHDWKLFWQAMESGGQIAVLQGEAYGLREILPNKIKCQEVEWFDTGVEKELEATRKNFEEPDAPNILEKANEAIWFLSEKVIKFSDDTKFISDRVKRAELLKGYVPRVIGNTEHMYCYEYAKGEVLSKCISRPTFEKLLAFSENFWVRKELNNSQQEEFDSACRRFYQKKTYDRIEQFYKKFNKSDNADFINEERVPKLSELLDMVDWDHISDGVPVQFHGDFHFENILYDKAEDRFTLLDWRQNFGNSLEVGDIYYDFAKLNHGLIICHELIAKDLYSASWEGNELRFDFTRKQKLVDCEERFYTWLEEKGYDVPKVKLMTALIFLNICALHHDPYVLLLYGLGKQMLYDALKEQKGADPG